MRKPCREKCTEETKHTVEELRFGRISKQSCPHWREPEALRLSEASPGTANLILLEFISTYHPLHPPPVWETDISASF